MSTDTKAATLRGVRAAISSQSLDPSRIDGDVWRKMSPTDAIVWTNLDKAARQS